MWSPGQNGGRGATCSWNSCVYSARCSKATLQQALLLGFLSDSLTFVTACHENRTQNKTKSYLGKNLKNKAIIHFTT